MPSNKYFLLILLIPLYMHCMHQPATLVEQCCAVLDKQWRKNIVLKKDGSIDEQKSNLEIIKKDLQKLPRDIREKFDVPCSYSKKLLSKDQVIAVAADCSAYITDPQEGTAHLFGSLLKGAISPDQTSWVIQDSETISLSINDKIHELDYKNQNPNAECPLFFLNNNQIIIQNLFNAHIIDLEKEKLTLEELKNFNYYHYHTAQWDEKSLLCYNGNSEFELYNVKDQTACHVLKIDKHLCSCPLIITHAQTYIASTIENPDVLGIWDYNDPHKMTYLEKLVPHRIERLAFSPNSKFLAIASTVDRGYTIIYLLQWEKKQLSIIINAMHNIYSIRSIFFKPSGNSLVIGNTKIKLSFWKDLLKEKKKKKDAFAQ